jgi:hypothetical protein
VTEKKKKEKKEDPEMSKAEAVDNILRYTQH